MRAVGGQEDHAQRGRVAQQRAVRLRDGRLVDVHVRRLRMKVELDPANPRHVITVRGLGYKLQP